ncbi:MAG: glutamate synthase subunit alpha, partial [Egibacteraceae bacterium]
MAGLYDPRFEHDACGIGFVADASGEATRRTIEAALEGLCGVKHRGAVAADARTGDGAGVLLPLPAALLAGGLQGVDADRLGAAMCFLDGRDDADGDRARAAARSAVEDGLAAQGLALVGWREVPTLPEALGDIARAAMPVIEQALFTRPADIDGDAAERRCYVARKRTEAACDAGGVHAYFASWSFRTITYKAMSAADQLAAFYPDLCDREVVGWFGVFHHRYSTNTLPTWERAQPFRFLCHNGEI